MQEIRYENITIHLAEADGKVLLTWDSGDIILANQNSKIVSELIKENVGTVRGHYAVQVDHSDIDFNTTDLNTVYISIVLHYLYMYNLWKITYKREKDRSLNFDEKDFDNPSTHDIIFSFFKTAYPNDWKNRCAVLVKLSIEQLEVYYKERESFYNK